jgi:hypothetical protein
MATATATKRSQAPQKPEHKIGPLHNGLGVSIWLNSKETETGPRFYRSVTIAHRRYYDEESRQWKDAASYRPSDLATLVLALQAARDYCTRTPLPGQPPDGDEEAMRADEEEAPPDGETPF